MKSALSAQEKDWLDACLTVSPAELQPAQRHNLPAWLAGPLLARLGPAVLWLSAGLALMVGAGHRGAKLVGWAGRSGRGRRRPSRWNERS